MDNTVLNNIKERLLKDNDTRRWREVGNANAFANGYACGVENTLVAVAAAEAAEQQAQNAPARPRTNLDRIRAMSAEKIAKWAVCAIGCSICPRRKDGHCEVEEDYEPSNCAAELIKWLNSPAGEDGKNA